MPKSKYRIETADAPVCGWDHPLLTCTCPGFDSDSTARHPIASRVVHALEVPRSGANLVLGDQGLDKITVICSAFVQ